MFRRGNLVCATLPLSRPGPCRTGQAEVLVRALQQEQQERRPCYVESLTALDVGYGSRRAGTESLLGCLSRRRRLGDRLCSDSGGGRRGLVRGGAGLCWWEERRETRIMQYERSRDNSKRWDMSSAAAR
jgi:hypothetical protein